MFYVSYRKKVQNLNIKIWQLCNISISSSRSAVGRQQWPRWSHLECKWSMLRRKNFEEGRLVFYVEKIQGNWFNENVLARCLVLWRKNFKVGHSIFTPSFLLIEMKPLKIPRVDVEVYTVVVEDLVMVVQYTMNLKKLTNPCCQLPLSLQDSEEYLVTFHPDFRCPPAPLSRSHHLPLLPELAPP